ncbi:LysR family transcriptional regulator [Xylophilus sp. GOD-11R]|uniref:LysR family transcriptional regulator n=1 Tax=Xylophilus sp. GOD-11R TaxID=3089814 RepID=UPI00298BEC2C|nr:LysR family transcriptional regulator [Xylophilus sp. GOD-11R]WPB57414.1 LysR family transcriptional regulator [Xylophilus sp. GOD-11R]
MLKVTFRQLEAVFWTARLGTVHAAANHLNITQPAVSTRIREFEGLLGSQVFTRVHSRLELTAAGRKMLVFAEKALAAGQDLERLAKGAPQLSGLLRLGVDETAASVGLTAILREIKRLHPDLRVEITVEVGSLLYAKVEKRELDLAIHAGGGESPSVFKKHMGGIPFHWVAGARSPLAADASAAELAQFPIVTHQPGTTLYALVHDWFRQSGFSLADLSLCNSLAVMQDLVLEGHAIAILPDALTRRHVAHGAMRRLEAGHPIPPVPGFVSWSDEFDAYTVEALSNIVSGILREATYYTL